MPQLTDLPNELQSEIFKHTVPDSSVPHQNELVTYLAQRTACRKLSETALDALLNNYTGRISLDLNYQGGWNLQVITTLDGLVLNSDTITKGIKNVYIELSFNQPRIIEAEIIGQVYNLMSRLESAVNIEVVVLAAPSADTARIQSHVIDIVEAVVGARRARPMRIELG